MKSETEAAQIASFQALIMSPKRQSFQEEKKNKLK